MHWVLGTRCWLTEQANLGQRGRVQSAKGFSKNPLGPPTLGLLELLGLLGTAATTGLDLLSIKGALYTQS